MNKSSRDFTEIEQFENGSSSDRIIEIKSVFKTGKHIIQPAWDANTGWYAGVERLSDEEKKSRNYYITVGETKERSRLNTKLTLKDGLIFDLSKEVDALNWKWVRECKEVAMSMKEAQSGKSLFYVHIDGREAEVSNAKSDNIFEAMKHVMEDPTTNYSNRALLLGMEMDGESPAVIKEFLLEKARKKPMEILRVYRDKSMKINLLYVKAKQKGVITVNSTDGVVKYGDRNILGYSDDSAIAFLQTNPDILELLEREVSPEYFSSKQEKAKDKVKMTPVEKARAAKAAKAEEQED